MGTTVDSLYIRPSISGTAWSESGGRPAEAAAAESSTAGAAAMMGPFEGAGGAVAGALPTSTAGMEEGGVPDADMLPRRASPCGWEREEARLPLLFFFF